MFEDNPMLAINVKLLQHVSVIFPRPGKTWRVYVFVLPICILNTMQFIYLFRIWGNFMQFILNTFYATAILDSLFRTFLIIINRDKFEAFILEFVLLYNAIEQGNGKYAIKTLKEAAILIRKVSIFNLTLCVCNVTGATIFPFLGSERVHPFGIAFPGVDMIAFPVYEICYILQFLTPITLTIMYMPFVNLFASFAMFGKSALLILQHKIQDICGDVKTEEKQFADLKDCIEHYNRLVSYIKNFNTLVTYIILVEFLLFGTIICCLLFCINLTESYSQIFSIVMYIFVMVFVLFIYYWCANELVIESAKVSEAAYAIPWYYCSIRFRKTLLMFIMRTQRPLTIRAGNIYPMTLNTFQSLLNTSYSYFAMLRRFIHK